MWYVHQQLHLGPVPFNSHNINAFKYGGGVVLQLELIYDRILSQSYQL